MTNKPLTQDDIASLLTTQELDASTNNTYPRGYSRGGFRISPQFGPLRRVDVERPCKHIRDYDELADWEKKLNTREQHLATGGCRAPTYYRIKGVPQCGIHALEVLNQMLIDLGVDE